MEIIFTRSVTAHVTVPPEIFEQLDNHLDCVVKGNRGEPLLEGIWDDIRDDITMLTAPDNTEEAKEKGWNPEVIAWLASFAEELKAVCDESEPRSEDDEVGTVSIDEIGDIYFTPGKEVCDCEQPGWNCSGLPGVIAHVEDFKAMNLPERCDLCGRYVSDEAAAAALLRVFSNKESESQMTRRLTRRALREILKKAKFITVDNALHRIISTANTKNDNENAVSFVGPDHISSFSTKQLVGSEITRFPELQNETYLLVSINSETPNDVKMVQFFEPKPLIIYDESKK